jgi:hypothetical protein
LGWREKPSGASDSAFNPPTNFEPNEWFSAILWISFGATMAVYSPPYFFLLLTGTNGPLFNEIIKEYEKNQENSGHRIQED